MVAQLSDGLIAVKVDDKTFVGKPVPVIRAA